LSSTDTTTIASESVGSDSELGVRTSADEWFCRLGDQDLGPLSFDELLKYAELEQLSADDEVKLGEHGKWRRVGSIGRLMAAMPYKAIEKNIVPTSPRSKTPAREIPTVDSIQAGFDALEDAPEDDEDELEGSLDDLLDDDLLNGELLDRAAPVPARSAASMPAAPVAVSAVDAKHAYRVAFEEARTKIAESLDAYAESIFKTAEDQAKQQVAWATGPKADKQWWGWASGVEFGPVDFAQVFGLAKSGQLKPNDLVRNGQFNQFGPATNVPGLFSAIAMIARAAETLALAKSLVKHAGNLALPSPVVPEAILNPPPMPVSQPAPRPRPDMAMPANNPSRMGYESCDAEPARRTIPIDEPRPMAVAPAMGRPMSPSSSGPQRPVAAPPKKPVISSRSESTWMSDLMSNLKEPKVLGSLAAVVLVALFLGWGFLPKSKAADIKRYQALKQLLDEIRAKRSDPNELMALKGKATSSTSDMLAKLKKEASSADPAKQSLLWAVRDELPRVFDAAARGVESPEANFAMRLQEAAVALGLEKPEAVAASFKGAPLPDD
jgi:hypothetical protein